MRRPLTIVFFAAIAVAYALPMQSVGCAQTSHYAAIRSYSSGTPTIDRYAETTCDLVRRDGHFYAAKAPGLALLTVPWYRLLDAAGGGPRDRHRGLGFPAAVGG